MSAATADLFLQRRSVQNVVKNGLPMDTAAVAYQDTFAGLNSGKLRALVAGDVFAGLFTRKFDNSVGGPGGLDATGEVESGMELLLDVTGASAVTDINALVYASDDQTATKTSTSNSLIGIITQWVTGTTCWVHIFTPAERAAQ